MKGDIVVLATGRGPDIKLEFLPTEAEARRRVRTWAESTPMDELEVHRPDLAATADDTCAYHLFEPGSLRRRGKKNVLLTTRLRPELLERANQQAEGGVSA